MITHSEGKSAEVLNDISHVSKVGLKFWIYIHFRKGVMITIMKVWRKKCVSSETKYLQGQQPRSRFVS